MYPGWGLAGARQQGGGVYCAWWGSLPDLSSPRAREHVRVGGCTCHLDAWNFRYNGVPWQHDHGGCRARVLWREGYFRRASPPGSCGLCWGAAQLQLGRLGWRWRVCACPVRCAAPPQAEAGSPLPGSRTSRLHSPGSIQPAFAMHGSIRALGPTREVRHRRREPTGCPPCSIGLLPAGESHIHNRTSANCFKRAPKLGGAGYGTAAAVRRWTASRPPINAAGRCWLVETLPVGHPDVVPCHGAACVAHPHDSTVDAVWASCGRCLQTRRSVSRKQ